MKYRAIRMDNLGSYGDNMREVVAIVPAKEAAAVVKAINAWIATCNAVTAGKSYEELRTIKRPAPPQKLPPDWIHNSYVYVQDVCSSVDVPVWTSK